MRPSPGLALAVLLVLIVTQATRLLAPGRGPYVWSLAVSTAGLVAGEVVAGSGHLAAPSVGAIHPLLDAGLMAGFHATAAVLVAAPLRPGRWRR